MRFALYILSAYLVGSFPTGVVLSKRRYGIDVREIGSGNIGATNMTRVFGWYAGAIVLIMDFLKGYLPIFWIEGHGPHTSWLVPAMGLALVVGHCYSIFLGFKGGKGVATSLGVVTVLLPWGALWGVIAYIAAFAATRISAVGSLAGLATVGIYTICVKPGTEVSVAVGSLCLIVLVRHRSNIARLIQDSKNRRGKKSK